MRIYGNTTNTALQMNLLRWFSPFRWFNCEIALSSNYKHKDLSTSHLHSLTLTTQTHTEQPSHLSEWCKILFAPLRQQKVFGDTRRILTSDCVVSLHQTVQMLPAALPKQLYICKTTFFFPPFLFLVDFLKQKGLRRHKQTDTVKCY